MLPSVEISSSTDSQFHTIFEQIRHILLNEFCGLSSEIRIIPKYTQMIYSNTYTRKRYCRKVA